jgi:uncharacterized heparinase superfamily protein
LLFQTPRKQISGYYFDRALEKRKLALDGLGLRVENQEDKLALRQWPPDLRATATRLAFGLFPDLAALALKVKASRLRFTRIPELFSRHLRQISPSLNEELLDLYGRSEQILANRLTFFNLTEAFGAEIDWERHASPAWCGELHAFDYGLDLALTYRILREERYARHLRYLIAQWVSANPPGQGSGWMLPTLARRIRNWILAADLARDDGEQDPTFLRLVTESLALQAVYLGQQAGAECRGRGSLDCVRALELAARFFSGAGAAELASHSTTILRRALETGLRPEGRRFPAPPTAQLRLALTLMDLLLFGSLDGRNSNGWLRPTLQQTLLVLEGMLFPDGTLPLFGPAAESAPGTLSDLFALAAVIFNEPRWKSLAGEFGILPYLLLGEEGKTRFEQLPNQTWKVDSQTGLHSSVVRLVGEERSALLVNTLPTESSSGHQDFLSYELFLEGQRVIVDSGAFSPDGETWSPYFASPQAHNVLMVDGQGPRPLSSNGWGARSHGLESLPGVLRLRVENPGLKFLGLDHERVWYCLGDHCWLVLDWLRGTGSHRIDSLVHFYPTFTVELGDGRATVRSRSLAVTIIPLGYAGVVMTTSRGDHPDFPAWYAPDFGTKYAAAVLRMAWTPLQPPWLGGYLVVPGTKIDFHAKEINPAAGLVDFDLFGKKYRLQVR